MGSIPLRPTSGLDDPQQQRRDRETINDILTFRADDSRRRTAAERAAGVTPVNFAYPPGHAERFGTNTTPGTTDMTGALVNWAKSATRGLRMELAPGGLYMFDPSIVTNGVLFSGAAGFTIHGNGATIIAKAGAAVVAQQEMMRFNNCQDVYVENLTIDANRANRTPVEATAHNINIADNCARMVLKKVRCINAVTDGFYIGTDTGGTASTYPTDITLDDCTAENAYRNNCSVVASLRLKIKGGYYAGATGTAPQGGIDIEPDSTITSGTIDTVIEDVHVSGNVGYGLNVARSGGTVMNARVTLKNIRGDGNTGGLVAVSCVEGLDVDGVFCGPHSASTRGLFDIQSGSVTNVTLRNLNFNGVTINSAARWLLYLFGATGRVLVDGFRAYNCPNLPCILASPTATISNVELDGVPDAAINVAGAKSSIRNLFCNTATGRVVYINADDCTVENATFVDCLVASSNAMTVAAGATGSVTRNITVRQTSSIPASAVGLFYGEVPDVVQNVFCKSAGTDFTSANAIDFNAGTVGSYVDGCTPGGQEFLSCVISPAQITANTNDYAPTGLKGAAILRLNTDASRNITGLTGGAANRKLEIYNIGGTDIVFTDNDAASVAANRFLLGAAITLNANESLKLWYDGPSARWRGNKN